MKRNSILLPAAVLVSGILLNGGALFCAEPEAKKHKVWIWQETGDCLWNLAKKYYGDPYKWKLIYEANKDHISDPRVIFPRQIIEIPALDSFAEKKAEPTEAGKDTAGETGFGAEKPREAGKIETSPAGRENKQERADAVLETPSTAASETPGVSDEDLEFQKDLENMEKELDEK